MELPPIRTFLAVARKAIRRRQDHVGVSGSRRMQGPKGEPTFTIMQRRTGSGPSADRNGSLPAGRPLLSSAPLRRPGSQRQTLATVEAPLVVRARGRRKGHRMVRPGQQVAASGVPADGAYSTLERVLDTLGAVMELLQVPVPAHVRDDIQTRHEPMYLRYPGAADLRRVGIALG